MRIAKVTPLADGVLFVVSDEGRTGHFDFTPYLDYEAFEPLKDREEFIKVGNGGYFVEWGCGADLSADTIECEWREAIKANRRASA